MKIFHVNYSFTLGGIDTLIIDLLNKQVRDNLVYLVIINNKLDTRLFNLLDSRIKVFKLKRPERSRNPIFIYRFNVLLIRHKPDVVHCHNGSISQLMLFKSLREKSILTVHAMNLSTKHYSKFKKIYAISNSVKKDIYQRSNIDAKVIYNGVDFSKINTDMSKSNTPLNTFKIIQVGRLDHKTKGQDTLIKALSILKSEYKVDRMELDFVGEGGSEDYLRDLANERGLSANIRFVGYKNRSFIFSHLKDYNLLVQPSKNEGFGLSIIEGIAAGIPVLASDIDGLKEIAEVMNYDFLFRMDSPDDLAKKILQIMLDRGKNDIKSILLLQRENGKSFFSLKAMVNSYLTEYMSISN